MSVVRYQLPDNEEAVAAIFAALRESIGDERVIKEAREKRLRRGIAPSVYHPPSDPEMPS